MIKNVFKKQKGVTLLEIIIVLGIMGVIAAGVVILAQRAIDNQNTTTLAQQLNTIQTAMIQTFRGKGAYPESTTTASSERLFNALINMGKLSEDDKLNPFSGTPLEILSATLNAVPRKAFLIKVADLTQDQCASLITLSEPLMGLVYTTTAGGPAPSDVWMDANATATLGMIKSLKPGGTQLDLTDLDQIAALCGGEATGDSNIYDIYFGNR